MDSSYARSYIFIQYDNSGIFSAGSEVTGRVIFHVKDEDLTAKSLAISIIGQAKSYFYKTSGTHEITEEGLVHIKTVPLFRSTECTYIDEKATLWSSGSQSKELIPLGEYTYPFRFQLPPHCATTFNGKYGHICYSCTLICGAAIGGQIWDCRPQKEFTVLPVMDLNSTESVKLSKVIRTPSVGYLRVKDINVRAQMNKRGFIPGEIIELQFDIQNGGEDTILKIEAAFIKRITFSGYLGRKSVPPDHLNTQFSKAKSETFTLEQFGETLDVAPGCRNQWKKSIQVPMDTIACIRSPVIWISYEIKTEIHVSNWKRGVRVGFPMTIGTVPITLAANDT